MLRFVRKLKKILLYLTLCPMNNNKIKVKMSE